MSWSDKKNNVVVATMLLGKAKMQYLLILQASRYSHLALQSSTADQPLNILASLYCRSGNIRDVLIFANFAMDKFANSRISRKLL